MKKLLITSLFILSISITAATKVEPWLIANFLTVSPSKNLVLSYDLIRTKKVYEHPTNKNVTFAFADDSNDSSKQADVQILAHAYENDPVIFGWGENQLDFLLIVKILTNGRSDRNQMETIENQLRSQSDKQKYKTLNHKKYQTDKKFTVTSTTYSSIVNGKEYIQLQHIINERKGAYNIIVYPVGSNNYQKINKTVREILNTATIMRRSIPPGKSK